MADLALSTQYVKNYFTPLTAVIAENLNLFVSELIRHGCVLYFVVQLSVVHCHITEALETERALILVFGQLLKAASVHIMSAL